MTKKNLKSKSIEEPESEATTSELTETLAALEKRVDEIDTNTSAMEDEIQSAVNTANDVDSRVDDAYARLEAIEDLLKSLVGSKSEPMDENISKTELKEKLEEAGLL